MNRSQRQLGGYNLYFSTIDNKWLGKVSIFAINNMEYTLNLQSEEDYRIIKKILRAFEGASIQPNNVRKTKLENSLEEVRRGEMVGPFSSVKELMDDLLN